MKTLHTLLAITILSGAALMATGTSAKADYRHDDHGYWDGHQHYHHWAYYHHHRGYWDDRNGVHVWINL